MAGQRTRWSDTGATLTRDPFNADPQRSQTAGICSAASAIFTVAIASPRMTASCRGRQPAYYAAADPERSSAETWRVLTLRVTRSVAVEGHRSAFARRAGGFEFGQPRPGAVQEILKADATADAARPSRHLISGHPLVQLDLPPGQAQHE